MNEKIQINSPLVDQFSRTISYLRLSVTDHCNLRCIYCMPEEIDILAKSGKFLPHSELLSYEELLRVVSLAVAMGMNKLRLTGGEPLIRRGILDFIQNLGEIKGLQQIRLTTNGVLLGDYAKDIFACNIRKINISLDTLRKEKFAQITGRNFFEKVWDSLMTAHQLGFATKINVVAMQGVNDDEFIDFAQLALHYPFQVRFIEFMPAGDTGSWQKQRFISADEVQKRIATLGELYPEQSQEQDGPARMYRLHTAAGASGRIGFISPISHHFCDKCNRLRLTSDGRLRACLLRENEMDLKKRIRNGATDQELCNAIAAVIANKPQGHILQTTADMETHNRSCLNANSGVDGDGSRRCRGMSRIGG